MKRLKINQTEDQRIFFTSDSHFAHGNICGGTTNWVKFPVPYREWKSQKDRTAFCLQNGVRPFASLDDMNNELVDAINRTVRHDDILIHAGDWNFGNPKNAEAFRWRINCQNIHLIYGNHDEHIMDPKNNLHSMFASVGSYKELVVDGELVCVFHYKQSIWNKSHKGAYHLYGHSHSSAEWLINGRSMDIGVDNAFKLIGEFRPFSWEEIKHLLKDRQTKVIDHHTGERPQ